MECLEHPRKFDLPKLFLAPFFLFVTFFLVTNSIYVNKVLPIGGIFLCLVFQKKGFYFSLLLILIDSVFQHFASTSHIWLIGFELSLALSFWIFHHTYSIVKESNEIIQDKMKKNDLRYLEMQKQKDENIEQGQRTIQILEHEKEDLELSLKNIQSEMQSYLQLIDTLRESQDLEIQGRETLAQELMNKNQNMNALELELTNLKEQLVKLKANQNFIQEKSDLINELNYFRVKQFQTSLINEAFAYFTYQEIQKMKSASDDNFDKKNYRKVRQLMANYNQLKKQFRDKNQILHLTRKELYANQTECKVLKNMLEESTLEPRKIERVLSQELDKLLLENRELLRENKELEKILEKMMVQDHPSKS